MKNSIKSNNTSQYYNTADIMQICSFISDNFEGLRDKLVLLDAQYSFIKKMRYDSDKGILTLKVYFKLYDGCNKPFTFYENGGCHVISGQNFCWKNPTKEAKRIISNYKGIDLHDGIITIYKPYYYYNVEMKCGHDQHFFNKDTQTILLIQDFINKYHLNKFDFKDWHKTLKIKIDRKTHKNFTWRDLYYVLLKDSTKRGISIISEHSFCNKKNGYKQKYEAVVNMYIAKLNKDKKLFNESLYTYQSITMNILMERIYNPQIRNQNTVAYKIYEEVGKGNWCCDLLKKSDKINNINLFNRKQKEMYKYTKMKEIIYSSSNSEIKNRFFNSYKDVIKFTLSEIFNMNKHFDNVINENFKLFKLKKFKEFVDIKNDNKNNKSNYLTFNRVCKDSNRPFFFRSKNGKLRRYESYEKFQKCMDWLKDNQKNIV